MKSRQLLHVIFSFVLLFLLIPVLHHGNTRFATADDGLFADDFNDGNADGWTITNPEMWVVENGELVVEAMNPPEIAPRAVVGQIDWANYSYEVDMKGEQGVDKIITFRFQDEQNYYGLNMRSGFNDIVITKVEAGVGSDVVSTGYDNNNDTWYHLKVVVQGPFISVYVNGTSVIDYTDTTSTLSHGQVGMMGWFSKARYDNVVVASAEFSQLFLPIVNKPLPQPVLIYSDDFSDPNSGWPIVNEGDFSFGYQSGEYEMWLQEADRAGGVARLLNGLPERYFVQADAHQAAGSGGVYGLIYDWLDWDNFDLLLVYPDNQRFGVFRQQSNNWITLISMTTHPAIHSGGAVNRLKVVREAGQITLICNDQLLAVTSNVTHYYRRESGFYTQSGSGGPYTARFDNFQIWQLPNSTIAFKPASLPEGTPYSHTLPLLKQE